ncbi:hypothetical protein FRAAL2904 [Frankia alni ACN14a]|uniref:Uncharacterized protein n=1 Tax=Frankia alni (strain DSM 45986 / CECT 9034 / ACN14a) TaxID=326424 RepID=Q0RLQ6_FRAAA|nr:hypothetical protein FRAAL2904 [Frankia alni ACN14a]
MVQPIMAMCRGVRIGSRVLPFSVVWWLPVTAGLVRPGRRVRFVVVRAGRQVARRPGRGSRFGGLQRP